MIRNIRLPLLADASSDRCLRPVLGWLVKGVVGKSTITFEIAFADFRERTSPPEGLGDKINAALESYPCDVLFIHRDAEGEAPSQRIDEIEKAWNKSGERKEGEKWVPVIPVRMTEAWLLIDETAIRRAADNTNGTRPLDLPLVKNLESIPDPKAVLKKALLAASEKSGRRRKQFERDLSRRIHRVADLIQDFSPLRQLAAFDQLEQASKRALLPLVRY